MADLLTTIERRWQDKPSRVFLLALAINAIALLLSHNYLDGDPHTRTYMAMKWLKAPFFIYGPNDVTWVFAPLHCYLNAAVLSVWYDPALAPRLLSLLLTSLTIFPLYHVVKFEFGVRAAFYSALSVCFCTLFIHPAAIAVSEGINLLLVFSALFFFLRYRQSSRWGDLLLSAVIACLATMMRYDSGPLVSMMALLLVVYAFKKPDSVMHSNRQVAFVKAIVFGLISHSFAIMWMLSQWINLGHPMFMTVDSLDVPVINQNLARWGAVKVVSYHIAFLPGIMLLSLPLPAAFAAATGLFKTIKSRRFPILLWLLVAIVIYYLLTFVVTFSRFPLARFITLPTILFACFSGIGAVYWLDRCSLRVRKWVVPAAVFMMVATPLALGFFSRPSKNPIAEKLRAISPLTNPPDYYFEAVAQCSQLLEKGNRLVIDTRNYNHRLLYLDLNRYVGQIDQKWPTPDSLLNFIQTTRPTYVLRADYPQTDKTVFDAPGGSATVRAGDVTYHLAFRAGIYGIYALDSLK